MHEEVYVNFSNHPPTCIYLALSKWVGYMHKKNGSTCFSMGLNFDDQARSHLDCGANFFF